MERQKFCVYNRTSECFLSLGASLAEDAFGYLGQLVRRRAGVSDEGQWVLDPKPIHSLRLFAARDLVLLDKDNQVLEAIESWPSFRILRVKDNVASMLALPVHTVYSSQTQPGHQLVICSPEEMRVKLHSAPPSAGENSVQLHPEVSAGPDPATSKPRPAAWEASSQEPRLVAYDANDPGWKMYGVREFSASGLFLSTAERWEVGTQVGMTLQRMDGGEPLQFPLTVEMRVAGWARDGMEMVFVRPGVLEPLLTEMIGR